MGLRKLFSLEHPFQVVCSNRRVISGLGAGVLASLLVLSLLLSVGSNGGAASVASSPSSLLSWFFSVPGDGSGRVGQEYHELSSGKVSVSEGEADVGGTPPWRDARGNPGEKGRVSENAHLENPIGEDTQDGSSALQQGGGLGSSMDGNITGTGNGTVPVKAGVLEKPKEGNVYGKLGGIRSPGGEELPPGRAHTTNLSVQENDTRVSATGTSKERTNITSFLDGRGNGTVGDGEEEERRGFADSHQGSGPRMESSGLLRKCDIFSGRWVRDESKPYYPPRSCPVIDGSFDCHHNGRPDHEFLKWRWQPNDCDIPSFNATDFLKRLKGQRLIFVGDSLNRNMWESLVCILRQSIKHKNRVYEMSGRSQFKTEGYYSFIFKDYNCSVDFVRSPFLVKEYTNIVNGSEDEKLRLDVMDSTTLAYHEADIVVFNTGHWWTHEKTSRGVDYYQEGDHVYPILKALEAYRRALSTWAKWVDKNINPNKTQVVFRGYSLTHFRGGQWNSGGQCHKEMVPIFNESYVGKYPAKMRALEQVVKQMKTPVIYLNISRLTDYRKDGHPSIYRKKYESVDEQINAEKTQDCSHWCLPGVPDTWNELLYASLLMAGRGSWKK